MTASPFAGVWARPTLRIFFIFVALRARSLFVKFPAGVTVFAIDVSMVFVQNYPGNDMLEILWIPTAVTNLASLFKLAKFAFCYMASAAT
jgi:hypothetical protein